MPELFRKTLPVFIALAIISAAHAGPTFKLSEDGINLNVGGDLRLRLTHYNRNALPLPGGTPLPAPPFGGQELNELDNLQYLRLRTRVWGQLALTEQISAYARLVNRSQYFGDRHVSPKNDYGEPSSTWAFWDETVVDNLYLDVAAPFGANAWTLRLGRQDVVLGNGMVFLEGTPYDQGRGIYFDGLRADYACGPRTLTLLALHNHAQDDRGSLFNDQNRRLRRGETGVLGAYFTQKNIREDMSADLYAFHIDIDDESPAASEAGEVNHPDDENAAINLVGARLFGALNPKTDYSVELARQFGTYNGAGTKQDLKGWMADARLTLNHWSDKPLNPVLGLEYTYMSGAENDGDGDYEGWHPAFAEYPIWREELLPLKFYANWTNFHQARIAVDMALNPKASLQIAGATLHADEKNTPLVENVTPEGGHIGEQLCAFLDYQLLPRMTVSLEASQFYPGSHLPGMKTAEWLRFQTIFRF